MGGRGFSPVSSLEPLNRRIDDLSHHILLFVDNLKMLEDSISCSSDLSVRPSNSMASTATIELINRISSSNFVKILRRLRFKVWTGLVLTVEEEETVRNVNS